MPTGRVLLTSSVVNGKIYSIGGGLGLSFPIDAVEVFDPAANSWSKGPRMPTLRNGLTSSVVNGKIYAIGGYDYPHQNASTTSVPSKCSTLRQIRWRKGPSMPTAREGLTSSMVNGKIYAIGGDGNSGSSLSTVEVFDPAANSWSTGPSMPTARAYLTSSVFNGKIYAIGGVDSSGHILSTVEVFDPAANSWSTGPSMPTARRALTSSVVNSKIYAIGGEDIVGHIFSTVEVFDPAANSWSKAPRCPQRAVTSPPAWSAADYAIGGGRPPPLSTVEVFVTSN